MRFVACALAGRDHLEAAGAGPIHMFADQCRLIAPSEAIDHAGGFGLARQQRAGHRVSLHIDHDDVLAMRNGREGMPDTGCGNAGCFNDHLDAWINDQRLAVGADMERPGLHRLIERRGGTTFQRPTHILQLAARPRYVEIGKTSYVQTGRCPRLSEKHGAEFTRADQADDDRPPGSVALHEQGVQVHRAVSRAIMARIETRACKKYNEAPSRGAATGINCREIGEAIAMTSLMSRLLPASGAMLCVSLMAGAAYAQSAGQGSWTSKTPLDMARNEVVAAAANGKVYVLGGNTREKYDLTLNEEYDPATGRWRSRAPLPSGANHMAAASLNGKIYAVGGFTASGHKGATAHVFEFDPAADGWRTLAPLPVERGSIAVAVLGGKIHAIGGRNDQEMTALHHVYDPAANSWSAAAPMSRGRDHMVAQAIDGKIHAIGGRWGASTERTDTHEIYDPATNSWTLGPPLPTARSGGTGIVFRDMILVVGGESGSGGTTFVENEAFDPKTNKWVTLAPMPAGRHAFGLAVAGSTVYLMAGSTGPGGSGITPDVIAFTLQ